LHQKQHFFEMTPQPQISKKALENAEHLTAASLHVGVRAWLCSVHPGSSRRRTAR
jgi:hypothetical protein